jgi:hypothetical protein
MDSKDLWGTEFDWYASDHDGHVALLSTAGNGLVPTVVLQTAADVDLLDQYFQVPDPARGVWEEFAALGLYVYDCGSLHEETYRRLAVPASPLRQGDLPDRLARAVGVFHFSDLTFADTLSIDGKRLT